MSNPKQIDHEGTILEIKDGRITVEIINVSACARCHTKGTCTVSDKKKKLIDVIDYNNKYCIGEKVKLIYQESLGWFALMLAYVIPLLLVLLVLFITTTIINNELISGFLSVAILVPYYIILSFFKGNLKNTFSFTIEKIVNV